MMRKTLFKLSLLSFGAVALSIVFSPANAEAASCKTEGDVHGYAGLIVNSLYKDHETDSLRHSDNTKVRISNKNIRASAGGNVVQLNGGPEGVSNRKQEAVFSQITLGYCHFNSDVGGSQMGNTTNVVLGHNTTTTSTSNHGGPRWGLDCDASFHGVTNEQEFNVTGVGVPSGARAGGTWNTKVTKPPNGDFRTVTIVYDEPPPPDVRPEGTLTLRCRNDGILLRNIKDENGQTPNNATSIRVRVIGHGVIFDSEDPGKNRIRGDRDLSWPGDLPRPSNNRVELLIRNIAPNNSVNNNGRKLITRTIDCPPDTTTNADLSCDRVRIKSNTVNNWTNGDNGENYRFILWIANTEFGPGQSPGNNEAGRAQASKIWTAIRPGSSWENLVYNFGAGGPYSLSKSGHVYMQVRVYQYDGSGSKTNWGNWALKATHREGQGPCYVADCTVDVGETVPGAPAGSNDVRAGEGFPITVTVTNKGRNAWTNGVGLWPDGGHNWNWIPPYSSGQVPRESSESFSTTLLAPDNQAGNHFKYKVYTGGVDPIKRPSGGSLHCETSVNTYKEFDINPLATSMNFTYNGAAEVEEPNEAVLGGNVDNGIIDYKEAKVDIPVTARFVKNPGGANHSIQTRTYHDLGASGVSFTAPVSSPQLYDEYCGEISVSPAAGWEGPGGHRYVTEPSESDGFACSYIANRPYVRAYGADIAAGSLFIDSTNGACNANPSPVKGYVSGRPNKSGSGSQLAAIAMQAIEGFRTASLRTAPPTTVAAPNGLSFGNDPPVGNYQGISICSSDLYGETQADEGDKKNIVSTGALTPNSHPGHDQTLYNDDLVLNGTGPTPFNDKKIIYVNGDVRITGNIEFAGFADPLEAPSFTLVASGNIYISKNVSRLDGIYVAQARSDGSGGGTIHTCSKPTEFDQYRAGSTELLDNCYTDAQLTVNGAFVAVNVELLRVYKSLRDSEDDHLETAGNTDAAEVFNYSPEIYLSPPPFAASSSSAESQFYTTLPPIL